MGNPGYQFTLFSCFLAASMAVAAGQSSTAPPAAESPTPFISGVWPSTPPPGCPFPPSDSLAAVAFTGRQASYEHADTWYPSWAVDGNLYSPWTDGKVNGQHSASWTGAFAVTGCATITGDDPLHLQVINESIYSSDASPYGGRYPCGSLLYNGVWYYGTYCVNNGSGIHNGIKYNWPWLGPFVGFRYSTDYGKTWTETSCTPSKPLFGEAAPHGEPLKIGAPHFVDFGKNMEHSPDGCAYLVAHGASDGARRRYGYNSWITGDQIYLVRVKPSIEAINDASKYEFFAGYDAGGEPIWSKEFAKIQPIAAWRDNMGCANITYDAPLKKYLMCVTDGRVTVSYFNTYILESDRVTGPWKLVSYFEDFGEQGYFVNIPSKFISADGRTLWLCYSANFSPSLNGKSLIGTPFGSRYGMCLHEVNLLAPGAAPAPGKTPEN